MPLAVFLVSESTSLSIREGRNFSDDVHNLLEDLFQFNQAAYVLLMSALAAEYVCEAAGI